MQSKIVGILLYRKVIKENDLYIKILSQNDEIISGIVYGGSSSKKKNIYQIGYYLNLRINKKNIHNPFKIEGEITHPLMGSIIYDKYKLFCLLSLVSLINLSIIEGQNIKGIFSCVDQFLNKLIYKKQWINFYCIWLFDLLKLIGYELDYKSNLNNKYFDINVFKFRNIRNKNSLDFPHEYLLGKKNIKISYIENIFFIFERVFQNNHLSNFSKKLPYSYINFKNIILDYLSNNND